MSFSALWVLIQHQRDVRLDICCIIMLLQKVKPENLEGKHYWKRPANVRVQRELRVLLRGTAGQSCAGYLRFALTMRFTPDFSDFFRDLLHLWNVGIHRPSALTPLTVVNPDLWPPRILVHKFHSIAAVKVCPDTRTFVPRVLRDYGQTS